MKDLKFTPGPWKWTIEDYSCATLHGPDSISDHVLDVSPCDNCRDLVKEKGWDWKWGRCTTPELGDAILIAKAPEMYEALKVALKVLDTMQPKPLGTIEYIQQVLK